MLTDVSRRPGTSERIIAATSLASCIPSDDRLPVLLSPTVPGVYHVRRASFPAVSLTTLIFASVLAVIRPLTASEGGRAQHVEWRLASSSFPVCLFKSDQQH
jgi:hypothetical protein